MRASTSSSGRVSRCFITAARAAGSLATARASSASASSEALSSAANSCVVSWAVLGELLVLVGVPGLLQGRGDRVQDLGADEQADGDQDEDDERARGDGGDDQAGAGAHEPERHVPRDLGELEGRGGLGGGEELGRQPHGDAGEDAQHARPEPRREEPLRGARVLGVGFALEAAGLRPPAAGRMHLPRGTGEAGGCLVIALGLEARALRAAVERVGAAGALTDDLFVVALELGPGRELAQAVDELLGCHPCGLGGCGLAGLGGLGSVAAGVAGEPEAGEGTDGDGEDETVAVGQEHGDSLGGTTRSENFTAGGD
jgi:hypothetical protein